MRVATDWLLDAVLPRQAVQLGMVRSWAVPLESASPETVRAPVGVQPRKRRPSGTGEGSGRTAGEDTAGDGEAGSGR